MANLNEKAPRCLLARKALVVMFVLMLPGMILAQAQQDNQEGRVLGDYMTQQSVELGYRMTDVNGNGSVYETLVGLDSGPRILDYTLSMRSMSHVGSLFDSLYFNNAGYGGDPNNFSRLRMSKNRWYNFSGSFRRDVNYFDFSTLANPYNTANAYVSNADSPHAMNTRRKMGDFGLTLAPQSRFRVRLGYARNVNEGPTYVTYHEGTEVQLDQNYRSRGDRYSMGADWKFAPRTQVSYDWSYEYNKMDTTWVDDNLGIFTTTNGMPVDLGVIYEPALYRQPCSVNAISPAPIVGAGNVVKPDCQMYSMYSRTSPTRANFTTHQLNVASNYFKNLDIHLAGTYSTGKNEMKNFLETANNYVSRTNEVGFQFSGPASIGRVSDSAEFGLTYHITDQVSLSNQARWFYWRIPGTWDSLDLTCYASAPIAPSSASPNNAPGPYAGILTPPGAGLGSNCAGLAYAAGGALSVRTGTAAAPSPDSLEELYQRYSGEESLSNITLLHFEPTRKLGVHAGFKYENRNFKGKEATSSISINVPYKVWTTSPAPAHYVTVPATTVTSLEDLAPAGNEQQTEQALLFGFHATPLNSWRLVGDFEKRYIDHPFTRISPKNAVKLKVRSTYRVARVLTLGASLNLLEGSNGDDPAGYSGIAEVRHKDHNRNTNVYADWTPLERINVNFGYTYGDLLARTGTCMPITSGIAIEGGTLTPCVTGTAILPVMLRYSDITNTGYVNLTVRPVKRVLAMFGYDLTSTSGSLNWYRADTLAPFRLAADKVLVGGTAGTYVTGPNPRVSDGSQAYNFMRPSAALAIDLVKNVTLKGAFNYYDYNEKSAPTAATSIVGGSLLGITPRDFHGNAGTVSLRCAF